MDDSREHHRQFIFLGQSDSSSIRYRSTSPCFLSSSTNQTLPTCFPLLSFFGWLSWYFHPMNLLTAKLAPTLSDYLLISVWYSAAAAINKSQQTPFLRPLRQPDSPSYWSRVSRSRKDSSQTVSSCCRMVMSQNLALVRWVPVQPREGKVYTLGLMPPQRSFSARMQDQQSSRKVPSTKVVPTTAPSGFKLFSYFLNISSSEFQWWLSKELISRSQLFSQGIHIQGPDTYLISLTTDPTPMSSSLDGLRRQSTSVTWQSFSVRLNRWLWLCRRGRMSWGCLPWMQMCLKGRVMSLIMSPARLQESVDRQFWKGWGLEAARAWYILSNSPVTCLFISKG